ncbi:MAG: hypothetical protein Q8P93_01355 [bacterium]|nr:hypothetical protein [bacterium]
MKSDETYLRHILDAINNIDEYIGDADLASSLKDNKTVNIEL